MNGEFFENGYCFFTSSRIVKNFGLFLAFGTVHSEKSIQNTKMLDLLVALVPLVLDSSSDCVHLQTGWHSRGDTTDGWIFTGGKTKLVLHSSRRYWFWLGHVFRVPISLLRWMSSQCTHKIIVSPWNYNVSDTGQTGAPNPHRLTFC